LTELVYLAKVKKGKLTAQQAKQQQAKWKQTLKTNTALAYYNYYKNEPDNIFDRMAYYKLCQMDRSIELENLKTGNFYLGMSVTDFNRTIKNKMYSYSAENSVMEKYKNNRISFTAYDKFSFNPITNSDYNFIIGDISNKKKEKYADEIIRFNEFATESTNNELAKVIGGNYRISIPYAFLE